jgi:hypothetical protein
MLPARAGRFESKVFARANQGPNTVDHDPTGSQCNTLDIVGRQASGDFVGVDELLYPHLVGKQRP